MTEAVFARDDSPPSCEGSGDDSVVVLPCALLLACHELDIRPNLFHAVNESGIAFDGRIAVDFKMRTSDANILAGGELTKFSRSLRRPFYHSLHSPAEVGRYLADCVAGELDPAAMVHEEATEPSSEGPRFLRPRAVQFALPMGKYYMRVATAAAATNPMSRTEVLDTSTR